MPSEPTFPLSCRRILTDFITSVSSHLSRKRTADTFLQFLTNSSSIVIVFLNELSEAFETTAHSSLSPGETVKRYLELFPESDLANVLANHQQRRKLNMAADDILSNFLDPKLSDCSLLRNFLREIFVGVAFESTISSLSRPEFINSWIIYLLREGESEIMSAIDAGVEGARNHGVTLPNTPNDMDNSALVLEKNTESDIQRSSKNVKESRNHVDKATEEAIVEAKRLSDMIAAQDALRRDSQQGSRSDHPDTTSSSDVCSMFTQPAPSIKMVEDAISTEARDVEIGNTIQISTNYDLKLGKNWESMDQSPTPLALAESQSGSIFSRQSPPLTLCDACVSVDDGSGPEERGIIRSKPISDYLLQIEPVSLRRSGWMVFRKYADFESLHETLGTISRLNKIQSFSDKHPFLPPWKGQTKYALARSLERYLRDALQHESLAESERMRRFLGKDEALVVESMETASTNSGFSFPSPSAFETVGKSVLDALTNAPKGVAGGSKAVLHGVTGVLASVAGTGKKPIGQATGGRNKSLENVSMSNQGFHNAPKNLRVHGTLSEHGRAPESYPWSLPTNNTRSSSFDSCSHDSLEHAESPREERSNVSSGKNANSTTTETIGKGDAEDLTSLDIGLEDHDRLCSWARNEGKGETKLQSPSLRTETEISCQRATTGLDAGSQQNSPITREETQIAVELIFAVINELYSLSSAWNIRRTLLNAAKSYILRPGSPNLETIRALLQDSMIDAHTSDEALGAYLTKLREGVLPTEEERESSTPRPSEAEKERLRETARKLFVQRGMPQAVMSVMGATASREALEKIFECLQVEVIARGFVFSLLLQALKVVIL